MLLIDSLAEEQIQAAIRRGDFDDLPGRGRPLELDRDDLVPDALRVGYRVLKNAGCLPPELMLRNEISEVEALLDRVETDGEQLALCRRLQLLKTRLALHGREVSLLERDGAYRAKLLTRFERIAANEPRTSGVRQER